MLKINTHSELMINLYIKTKPKIKKTQTLAKHSHSHMVNYGSVFPSKLIDQ